MPGTGVKRERVAERQGRIAALFFIRLMTGFEQRRMDHDGQYAGAWIDRLPKRFIIHKSTVSLKISLGIFRD